MHPPPDKFVSDKLQRGIEVAGSGRSLEKYRRHYAVYERYLGPFALEMTAQQDKRRKEKHFATSTRLNNNNDASQFFNIFKSFEKHFRSKTPYPTRRKWIGRFSIGRRISISYPSAPVIFSHVEKASNEKFTIRGLTTILLLVLFFSHRSRSCSESYSSGYIDSRAYGRNLYKYIYICKITF